MELDSREVRAIGEVRDALGCSLDIREVLGTASPMLLKIVPADYAAVGLTKPGSSNEFEWIAGEMPARFFEAYADMAPHDFVLRSVLGAPGQVLRDSEMLPRSELEANMMYGRARDLGMPIEHVMSTLLCADGAVSGGVSLYRRERRPFSERDCRVLLELAPALKNAVRNCRLHGEAARRGDVLEALLSRHGVAAVILSASGREVVRSEAATRLIEKWFSPAERTSGWLPDTLVDHVRGSRSALAEGRIWRSSGRVDLVVRLHSIPHQGNTCSVLVLEEVSNTPSAPAKWRERLTPREYEVADRVVRGWDNRLVAEDLGCAELTAKTHLKHVYEKLGVETRAQLVILAMRHLPAEAGPGSVVPPPPRP